MAGVNTLMERHRAIAAAPHLENQNGSVIHTKKALAKPVKSLLIDIDPVQTGSGDPSPENIRPISGWSGVKLFISPNSSSLYSINPIQNGSGDPSPTNVRAIAPGLSFALDGNERMDVYGGVLDVASGTLMVDRLGRFFDGTEEWEFVSDSFYRFVDRRAICSNNTNRACSHFISANVSSYGDSIQEDASGEDFRIVTQPVDCVMPVGEMAWFKVVATGVVSYQWQYHNGNRWKDYDVETAHDATFYIETVSRRYGYLYRCKLTGENDEVLYTDTVRIIEPTGYYAYTSYGESDTRIQIWPEIESVTNKATWTSWLAAQYANGTPVTCLWEIAEPIIYHLSDTELHRVINALGIIITTYDFAFPSEAGDVYGGVLDVANGTLMVDRLGRVFDGTERWAIGSESNPSSMFFRYVDSRANALRQFNCACSHFANATETIKVTNTIIGYYVYSSPEDTSNARILIRPGIDSVTNKATWTSWLAAQYANGTPVTCLWGISEPIIYQLTPTQISLLTGTNHIWADSGETTIKFWSH